MRTTPRIPTSGMNSANNSVAGSSIKAAPTRTRERQERQTNFKVKLSDIYFPSF